MGRFSSTSPWECEKTTTIIEAGLDIPNCNTIIINNAHQFGLSDLHQLRGRVGRSNRKAFCYLFSPPLSVLTNEARKRLQTLARRIETHSGPMGYRVFVDSAPVLEKALAEPARPMVAIVGGSKVSTKLTVLETLSDKVDQLVVGGGIANTFLAAAGKPVGKSLCEHDLIPAAKSLMEKTSIPLPVDVVTGKEFSESTEAEHKLADQVVEDDMIFDIGPEAAEDIATILKDAGTILWNGPVGVFEIEKFSNGSKAIGEAIVAATKKGAFSLVGGGDSVACVNQFGFADGVSYISTAGGAFLEWLEGKILPGIAAL